MCVFQSPKVPWKNIEIIFRKGVLGLQQINAVKLLDIVPLQLTWIVRNTPRPRKMSKILFKQPSREGIDNPGSAFWLVNHKPKPTEANRVARTKAAAPFSCTQSILAEGCLAVEMEGP